MKNLMRLISIFSFVVIFAVAGFAQSVLTSTDGQKIDVESQSGKVVILAFGASWLPLSGQQVEYTNALAKKYAGKNVAIYFVATDSSNPKSKNYATMDGIRGFAAANKVGVPVLHDPDGAVALKKFKVDQVPSFVILDKNGSLASEQFGGITTDKKFDVTAPIIKVVDKLL